MATVGGPYARLPRRERHVAMWGLGAAVLAQGIPLLRLEQRLRRAGGCGIIAFELAGTPQKAREILDRWGPEGRSAARLSLILDVPFPPTYAVLQALGCTTAAETFAQRDSDRLAAAGGVLASAQLAAALFDYIENGALMLILTGRSGRLPGIARRAALAKFGLLSAGWSYMLLAAATNR